MISWIFLKTTIILSFMKKKTEIYPGFSVFKCSFWSVLLNNLKTNVDQFLIHEIQGKWKFDTSIHHILKFFVKNQLNIDILFMSDWNLFNCFVLHYYFINNNNKRILFFHFCYWKEKSMQIETFQWEPIRNIVKCIYLSHIYLCVCIIISHQSFEQYVVGRKVKITWCSLIRSCSHNENFILLYNSINK